MRKNDAPRIIIQLIISAIVFFLFSYKYKSAMISFLSEQVYYQVLVILVILSGYASRWVDDIRFFCCHKFMMFFFKHYRLRYLKESADSLSQQAQHSNISESARKMVTDIVASDFELEGRIESLHDEIKRAKR